jgi:hypothetical protein
MISRLQKSMKLSFKGEKKHKKHKRPREGSDDEGSTGSSSRGRTKRAEITDPGAWVFPAEVRRS